MNQSAAFIAFYTLLLGLGIAALLTGLADIMRHHRLREVGLVGGLLSVLIIFEFLTGWSGATRSFGGSDANVVTLLPAFATGACYFLAAVLIFPLPGELGQQSVRDTILGQVRTIAALLFVANVTLLIAENPAVIGKAAVTPGYLWGFYVPYNGAILTCYAVMIAVPRRTVAVVAMVALLLVYSWVAASGSL